MAKKSNLIPATDSLSRAQRRLVRDYFERDKDALYDVGMDDVEIYEFLSNPFTQSELHRLTGEFDDRKQQMERIRHRVRLDLTKLAPLAVGVIQQALIGRITGDDGTIAEPPDRAQVDAAKEVMHNLGIAEKIQDVGDADIYIDNRQQINFPGSISAESASAATKRENIRAFVESVLADAESAHSKKDGGTTKRLIDGEAKVVEPRKKVRKKNKNKKKRKK